MVKVKIKKGTAKNKAWKVEFKDPKTGRKRTIQGGQKGARVMPKTAKAKSFKARHGVVTTAKKYINDKMWSGKKIGEMVKIPNKFI
jgi:hypothetical protein